MASRTVRTLSVGVAVSLATLGLTAIAAAPAPAATTVNHPFPTHVTYQVGVMPSASQSTRDAAVETAYNSWKSTYLIHGCASNEYYVSTKGDNDARNNGPVSEGQGYGMNIVPLMAGFDPNAQTEFNGLWQLVQDHEDQFGMMQWQLDGNTCQYYSGGTPDGATDGDLDIGYGLILADQQWGGYRQAALTWLGNFFAHDVASDGHLKAEDDDSFADDSRPSDYMLDHLRAFAAYDPSHNWAKVITKTESIISEFTASFSPNFGLIADFIRGANTTSPHPAAANFQEDQPDNIVGYNSIRVPWHMGTDALENGTSVAATAYADALKWSACDKSWSKGTPTGVWPHMNLNCTGFDSSPDVGDTVAEEAGDSVGPAAMASGDQAWTDAIWNELGTNPFGDHYFGETIKMIVYIVMAGDYWNPVTVTTPANDFSLSAAPASASVAAGGSATSTISTAVTSGAAESVALSASGAPSGVSVSFSPASVNSGATSTMTVTTSSSTAAGTYPITVTGTAASGSHTTTYTLTVTPAGGGGCTPAQLLANPGFEGGTTITPWTESSTTGSNPINNDKADEPTHSGNWDAWLNGDGVADTDTVAQTVTIPAGCSATASFWLHIDTTESTSSAKPDTLSVQVRDGSGNVLATPATFSNLNANTGYAQHSLSLSAYAGQTITLTFSGTETDANGGTTSFVIDDTALQTS